MMSCCSSSSSSVEPRFDDGEARGGSKQNRDQSDAWTKQRVNKDKHLNNYFVKINKYKFKVLPVVCLAMTICYKVIENTEVEQ